MAARNKMDALVYGATVTYHPVTDMPLQIGSGHLSAAEQAREHLQVIARERGIDEAKRIAHKLQQFEAAGGVVEMPVADVNFEFSGRR